MQWEFVPIFRDDISSTPWPFPRPVILDTRRARNAGFYETATYEEAVLDACRRHEPVTSGVDWRSVFTALAAYPENMFDYDADDAYFATHGTGR